MPVSDQGASLDRYMLIPRVLIFLLDGESVLLLKGGANKRLWAGRYNGIGGHVERRESILQAARRELKEESGLDADLCLCGTVVVDTERNPGIALYVFTGHALPGKLKDSPEGNLEWVSLAKVKDLPVVEDLPVLLERLRRMQPGDAPFHARSCYRNRQLIIFFD